MTLYVGTKVRRTWTITDMTNESDLDITEDLTIEWVFKFANEETAKIVGTKNLTG